MYLESIETLIIFQINDKDGTIKIRRNFDNFSNLQRIKMISVETLNNFEINDVVNPIPKIWNSW